MLHIMSPAIVKNPCSIGVACESEEYLKSSGTSHGREFIFAKRIFSQGQAFFSCRQSFSLFSTSLLIGYKKSVSPVLALEHSAILSQMPDFHPHQQGIRTESSTAASEQLTIPPTLKNRSADIQTGLARKARENRKGPAHP